jgi:hypothetical protein
MYVYVIVCIYGCYTHALGLNAPMYILSVTSKQHDVTRTRGRIQGFEKR